MTETQIRQLFPKNIQYWPHLLVIMCSPKQKMKAMLSLSKGKNKHITSIVAVITIWHELSPVGQAQFAECAQTTGSYSSHQPQSSPPDIPTTCQEFVRREQTHSVPCYIHPKKLMCLPQGSQTQWIHNAWTSLSKHITKQQVRWLQKTHTDKYQTPCDAV